MNINLNSIEAFLKAFIRPHPARDWFIALAAAFVIFFLLASYATYLFFGIQSGSVFTSQEGVTPPSVTVTHAELEDLLGNYRIRKINFDAHTHSAPVLIDPST